MRSPDDIDDDDDDKEDGDNVTEDANEWWRFHSCDGEWPPVAMAVEVLRYPIIQKANYSSYKKVCDNDVSVVYKFDSGRSKWRTMMNDSIDSSSD
mmetsp:Transcript_26819/g.58833  ORF Transcript_26819/g.58833 Transcript_26819/m.58833 type:complete len:95 (-) Transcript_26819:120-404(-)